MAKFVSDNKPYMSLNHFLKHLDELQEDIYPQPPDDGHTHWATNAIKWGDTIQALSGKRVLDMGCGVGFAKPIFESYGAHWTGVTWGEDSLVAAKHGISVLNADMTMNSIESNSHDVIFARHVLEHSPMPVITLMDWARIADELLLVAPSPDYWGWGGKNHYSMMNTQQLVALLNRSGWQPIAESVFYMGSPDFVKHNPDAVISPRKSVEFWYFCQKIEGKN